MKRDKEEVIGNFTVAEGKLKTRREILLMGAMAAGGLVTGTKAVAEDKVKKDSLAVNAPLSAAGFVAGEYKARDFSGLSKKSMEGLSANQIDQHLKLYNGYITKIKEIQTLLDGSDLLTQSPAPNATYAPLRELLIEQSFALNGVIYHELYFGNLGGAGGEPTGDLRSALEAKWGSTGKFMDYFKAAGKCMRGWVIIGWNTRDGQMHAYGLDMHNMWVPVGVIPVLVLDVYEHAYMIDYGINRAAYLDAFLKNIDWDVCNKRFASARKHPVGLDSVV